MLLLLLCVLVWSLIFLQQLTRRGLIILIIWLFVAPVATNLIERPGTNPFFVPQRLEAPWKHRGKGYLEAPTSIRTKELLEPTRIVVSALFGIMLLNALVRRKRLLPLDRIETWMVVFSLILIGNTIFQSYRVAFGLRVAMDAFLIPFMAYYVARRLIDEDSFRYLTYMLIVMGVYLIAICFLERLMRPGLMYRVKGPIGKPVIIGIIMYVVFFIAALDVFSSRSAAVRQAVPNWIRRSVFCFAPVVVFLTISRQTWVGFLSGLGVFLFLSRRLLKLSQKLVIMSLGLILVPLVLIGIQLLLSDLVENRIGNVRNIYGRFATWLLTLQQGMEHPIFGIGFNNMRNALAESSFQYEGMDNYGTVHNAYLAMFAEFGVLGLGAYLALMVAMVQLGMRLYRTGAQARDRWRGVMVVALMVAYLMQGFFDSTFYVTQLSHIYVYLVIGSIAGLYCEPQSSAAIPLSHPYPGTYIPTVLSSKPHARSASGSSP